MQSQIHKSCLCQGYLSWFLFFDSKAKLLALPLVREVKSSNPGSAKPNRVQPFQDLRKWVALLWRYAV